jgi:hypothetical protein
MVTRTLGRKPLSWPFKVIGWLVFGVVLVGVLAFIAVVGSGVYYELSRTTSGDVEGMFEADLVPGVSSSERAIAFLDANTLEHGPATPVDLADPRLKDVDVPAGATTVSGIVRNDGYALELTDVRFTLVFDAGRTLVDWMVWEVGR